METRTIKGDSPVASRSLIEFRSANTCRIEGEPPSRLNIVLGPIVNKYREGKLKSDSDELC